MSCNNSSLNVPVPPPSPSQKVEGQSMGLPLLGTPVAPSLPSSESQLPGHVTDAHPTTHTQPTTAS